MAEQQSKSQQLQRKIASLEKELEHARRDGEHRVNQLNGLQTSLAQLHGLYNEQVSRVRNIETRKASDDFEAVVRALLG